MRRVIVIALLACGCMGDIDPPWQLDHDRIVAVRATPPAIQPGQRATIDALLGKKGGMPGVAVPELALVVSPASLSSALAVDAGSWVVTAPSEDRLAAARAELKLATDAPVPLQISVTYGGGHLVATKTVELGRAADNPPLAGLLIDGKDAPDADTPLSVGKLVKVPLSVPVSDADFDVTWLTSCGTMHDFDLPQAYLKVEVDDPETGQLGVVVRDAGGGVSWRLWPIQAQ